MQNLTKNTLSGILAILAISALATIAMVIVWLLPIMLFLMGGVGLYIIIRLLLEDTGEKGAGS